MSFPKELIKIQEFLSKNDLVLSKPFEDGRINASVNEDEVLRIIKQKFDIIIPKSRNWYDFAIETKNAFYPVNIKITDTSHADNLNCKLGIYYALTGLQPDFANEIPWLKYFERLKDNLGKETDKDYYFLIVNKKSTQDVFVNSLKGLQNIQPNGNNLPFQCKWDINREFKKRSFKDATAFIIGVFGESIKLRSEIYFNFKKYFAEYV